jgi:uncharacterized coiled-coil DUF342 family protein
MKKRLIGTLLFGALFIASASMFTSCTDYDDDINDHSSLISNLQSQVDALESAKKKATEDLNSANAAILKAQADIASAQNSISAAEQAIRDAQATGNQAEADAQQAKLDAANAAKLAAAAQETANQAAAAAAQNKIDVLNELEAKVKVLNDAISEKLSTAQFNEVVATLATKDEMNKVAGDINKQIAALLEQLNATGEQIKANGENDAALKATVDAIQAKLDEIFNDAVRKGDFATAVAELNAQIAGVTGNVEAVQKELQALINTNAANIDKLSAEFTALGLTTQLVQQISTNQAAIAALEGNVKNLDDALKAIQNMKLQDQINAVLVQVQNAVAAAEAGDAATLAEAKAAAEAAIAAAKAEIEGQTDGKIDALTQTVAILISDLQVKVEALEAALADQENLNEIKAQIADLYAKANTFATAADVEGVKTALSASIATIEAYINGALQTELAKIATIGAKADANETKIANLQAEAAKINGIQNDLGTLATQINGANGINARLTNVEAELGALNSVLDGIAAELAGLENLDVNLSRVPAFAAGSSATTLANVLKTMSSEIKELNNAVVTMQGQVASLTAQMGVVSTLKNTVSTLQTKVDNITFFVVKNLTSLVYRPSGDNAYLYGFPTIKALLLQPQPYYTFGPNETVTASSSKISKQFDIVAYYWLNPSSTDISKYKFSFDEVASKNTITRGNRDNKKAGVSANVIGVDNKGVLAVALKISNGDNVNDAKTQGAFYAGPDQETYAWITTVALQAVRNDATVASKDTVTSDYAIIVPEYFEGLLLANNKYKATPHAEGNQKFHLNTVYNNVKTENAAGTYSYELAYNQEKDSVDLTSIDIHYNGDAATMTHKEAQDRGFTFKYTLLEDKDAFVLNEATQKIGVKNHANTSVGKITNVRVELQTDGKTVAYGYVSIIITSPKVIVDFTFPNLNIKCGENGVSLKWADVKKKIEEAIGYTGALDNYDWVGALSDLTKFKNTTTTETKKGIISIDATNFKWTFTQDEIASEFYKDGKPNNHEYKTQLHITPKAGHPELSNVEVNVTIPGVVYPTGEFSYTQRIQQYWFNQYSSKIAENVNDRKEIHGNVEVVAQTNANDEFFFNIAASFFNNKIETFTDPEMILIYDKKGFNYGDLATVYFDAEKYYIYNAAHANKTVAEMKSIAPATSFATGASGTEYLLYIDNRDSKILKAVKGKLVDANAQPVVVLSGTWNSIATYQGWTYFTGIVKDAEGKITAGNPIKFEYAYDLLNKNDHDELLEGQTFTTHMMLDNREWCFPIDFSGNDAFKFDIRYLRPISVDKQKNQTITDATDGDTHISLARLASFVDWRGYQFSATKNLKYLEYYGVRAIKPNLAKAETNINGDWLNIKYFPALEFIDNTTEGNGIYPNADAFYSQLGHVTYRNNGLNVGTFSIKLPITLLYDWGETAEQEMIITIQKTEGQPITAREK